MFLIYLIWCILFIIPVTTNTTQEANEYCSHVDCSLYGQHTMCAAANKQSDRLFASGMTTWMRHQILLLHNRHRDNIAMGLEAGQPPASNMRKMYWDFELEKMADVWASQCQKRHDECRNTIRFNVLQNMDVRLVVSRSTEAQLLTDAVDAWFSGSRVMPPENVFSFKLNNCSSSSGCNDHWYSVAAWASTWRLGCSQAICSFKKPTCALQRQYRKTQHNQHSTTTVSPKVIRRTSMLNTKLNFEDYNMVTAKSKNNESPLHRGTFDVEKKKKKEFNVLAFTVCNYGPAGNIEGFPIYNAGPPCINCPQNTVCGDHTHRALCAVIGDPDINLNNK